PEALAIAATRSAFVIAPLTYSTTPREVKRQRVGRKDRDLPRVRNDRGAGFATSPVTTVTSLWQRDRRTASSSCRTCTHRAMSGNETATTRATRLVGSSSAPASVHGASI